MNEALDLILECGPEEDENIECNEDCAAGRKPADV